MTLFSILIFPLSFLWLLSSNTWEKGRGSLAESFKKWFLFGVLFFIPAFLILKIVEGFLVKTWSVSNIYVYHLVVDFFIFQITLLGAWIFKFIIKPDNVYSGDKMFGNIFFLFSGFFTAISVHWAISMAQGFYDGGGIYYFFILPLLRLSLIFLSALILSYADENFGIIKILFFIIYLILPCIYAFVPFFYYIRQELYAYLLATVIVILFIVLSWFKINMT